MTVMRERLCLAALRIVAIHAAKLDALLVSSLSNIRYLTGFSGSSALLVVTAADALLLTDFRYSIQANAEVNGVTRVIIEPTSLWSRLWAELPAMHEIETHCVRGLAQRHRHAGIFSGLPIRPQGGAAWQGVRR